MQISKNLPLHKKTDPQKRKRLLIQVEESLNTRFAEKHGLQARIWKRWNQNPERKGTSP